MIESARVNQDYYALRPVTKTPAAGMSSIKVYDDTYYYRPNEAVLDLRHVVRRRVEVDRWGDGAMITIYVSDDAERLYAAWAEVHAGEMIGIFVADALIAAPKVQPVSVISPLNLKGDWKLGDATFIARNIRDAAGS